jgi:hypothetical protein
MRRSTIAAISLCVLAATIEMHAHHSLNTQYDQNSPITLHGRISRVEWQNPHAYVFIDNDAPSEKKTTWRVEVASPGQLAKEQITRDMFTVGTVVTINGIRARNGQPQAAGKDITLPDGSVRFLIEQKDLTAVQPVPFGTHWKTYWQYYVFIGGPPVVALAVGLGVMRRRRRKQKGQ